MTNSLAFCVTMIAAVLGASRVARADTKGPDMCVEYACRNNNNQPVTYRGTDVEFVALQMSWNSCTCSKSLHVATADEIADAIAHRIADVVSGAITKSTSDALAKMNDDWATREARIYERIAELERQNQEQIKLLSELLGAKGTKATPKTVSPPVTAPRKASKP